MGHSVNPDELTELAHRHLWMHFSRLGGYGPDAPVKVIARGQGCSLWDVNGHELLDGLSGLFSRARQGPHSHHWVVSLAQRNSTSIQG